MRLFFSRRVTLNLVLFACIGVAAQGCMGACDIFDHFTKELSGGYCLAYTSEFKTYVVEHCDGRSTFGVFDSYLTQVGWSDRYIVAWRVDYNRIKAGWMILDLQRGGINGPLSQQEFAALRAKTPALGDIIIHPANEVLR